MKARGRPRKAEADKLQPVSTSVDPEVYAMLKRISEKRRIHVSEVLRRIITGRLKNSCSDAAISG